MKKPMTRLLICSLLGLLAACGTKKEVMFSGKTMGTTYHITVVTGYFHSLAGLQEKIDDCLEGVNRSMSTFRPDSEISRFNAIHRPAEIFHASEDFYEVMSVARRLHELTDGAWDGTVDPLVNLWGFGRKGPTARIPSQDEIARHLADVGFAHIHMGPDKSFQKEKPSLTLDLGSIAKGYGVDRVAGLLRANRLSNYLVEIGGEVYAAGFRKDGRKWRVGINQPRTDAALNALYAVVELHDQGFATSGDYRNFFLIDGRRYSHVIDPHSGYPVANGVVSVSIQANNCTLADGLATAIMVMGPQRGLELLNRLKAVEGLIVVQEPDGALKNFASDGFQTVP
jgi:thiamine biosynthesis lipoprotein